MKQIWRVVKYVFLVELNPITQFPGHFVFLCQLSEPQITTWNFFFQRNFSGKYSNSYLNSTEDKNPSL